MTTAVKPGKPWKPTPQARIREASILVFATAFTIALVEFTPLKGKLAYFLTFFLAYALFTSVGQFTSRGAAAAKDAIIKTMSVKDWREKAFDLAKRPTMFLIGNAQI
jgi:hypothetical protein